MNRQKKKQSIAEKAVFGQWMTDTSEKFYDLGLHTRICSDIMQ